MGMRVDEIIVADRWRYKRQIIITTKTKKKTWKKSSILFTRLKIRRGRYVGSCHKSLNNITVSASWRDQWRSFFVLFTYRAIISTLKLILNVSSIYITFYFILHKVGEQHFFLYNSIETQEGEKKTELRMILDLFFFIDFIALGV